IQSNDSESMVVLRIVNSLMQFVLLLRLLSCFNFVPEVEYLIPADFRQELTVNGFEVGIHDLKHDGRLFTSCRNFKRSAAKINSYAREWGASGFRSGFMLRNLDCLDDVDVQ